MLARFSSFTNNTPYVGRIARCFTSLPVIDVSALVEPTATKSSKRKVAQELHEACTHVGFFYVTNHGVAPSIYQGVLDTARNWFLLPEHVKNTIAISPEKHYRGYQSLGANVTRYDGGFQRDWHEAIDLYKEEDPSTIKAKGLPYSPIHGPNQWPYHLPEFDAALRAYIAAMNKLGSSIMSGIALGLGLPEDFFGGDRAGARDSYWCVRVIYYPPLSEGTYHSSVDTISTTAGGGIAAEAEAALVQGAEVDRSVQLSCGEHTDYGLLTLVNQEEHVTALQVKNAQGQWINATPVPGSFVCNIGDMLKVWTNGQYTPTAHRVINSHPSSSRVSIPFFYEPCYEAVVEPLPHCQGPTGPQFKPVRYGAHLEGKVLRNFEL